jgi:hypothetical protein
MVTAQERFMGLVDRDETTKRGARCGNSFKQMIAGQGLFFVSLSGW